MADLDKSAVVIDQGASGIRAGLAGEDFPLVELRSRSDNELGKGPVDPGGGCESWHSVFQALGVGAEGRRLLICEPFGTSAHQRKERLELAFEEHRVSAVFMQLQPVLTLYALGLLTGLVLDCGEMGCRAAPVIDGYVLPHAFKSQAVGGRHVAARLLDLLRRRGYALSRDTSLAAVTAAKEKLCYLAVDREAEAKLARETTVGVTTYTLPDGHRLRLGAERFMAPEVLFDPQVMGLEAPGLAQLAHDAIQAADIDCRRALYQRMVLAGGGSLFPGCSARLAKDVRTLHASLAGVTSAEAGSKKMKINVDAVPRRKHLVFMGAAALADIMQDQGDAWVSAREWAEDPTRAAARCGSN
ncbi:ARP2 [Auxenochlorella protothecoides x Auxenochlorella symbiontica]